MYMAWVWSSLLEIIIEILAIDGKVVNPLVEW